MRGLSAPKLWLLVFLHLPKESKHPRYLGRQERQEWKLIGSKAGVSLGPKGTEGHFPTGSRPHTQGCKDDHVEGNVLLHLNHASTKLKPGVSIHNRILIPIEPALPHLRSQPNSDFNLTQPGCPLDPKLPQPHPLGHPDPDHTLAAPPAIILPLPGLN